MRHSFTLALLCAALCLVSCGNRNSKKSESPKSENEAVMDFAENVFRGIPVK